MSILNEDGSRTSTDDSIRAALRKVCKKEFVIDCVIVEAALLFGCILVHSLLAKFSFRIISGTFIFSL